VKPRVVDRCASTGETAMLAENAASRAARKAGIERM
jgi:hypothetical protein